MVTFIRKIIPTAASFACLTSRGLAQQQGPPAPGGNAQISLTSLGSGDLVSSLGRLGFTLVLVIALIWGTMWLARRVLRGRLAGGGKSDVRVVERLFLAPKKSVEIVSVGNRLLVLGVTENRISMLTEMEPGDMPAAMGTAASPRRVVESKDRRDRDLLRQARMNMHEIFQASRAQNADTVPQA